MLASLLDRACQQVQHIKQAVEIGQRNLSDHIIMKPREMFARSVRAGNFSTLAVILICYPILLYYRGLDYDLMLGMMLQYATFWCSIVFMCFVIQFILLMQYCLSQRFSENMLDFEVLDRVLNNARDNNDASDFDDDENSETMKRASG